MLATAGLNTAVLGLLHVQARSAAWVVLVGPLPPGLELEGLAEAARPGAPLLVVEPNPQRLERLQQDLEAGAPLPLTLRSELLAAEAGEQCWYRYNDPRHSGTTPPELLQARLPNLRLESLDLRPALPLSAVLESWQAERSAQGQPLPEGNGVLLLPLPEATAVLAGAGPWLEQLAAVFLHGPASEELPAALEAQLAAACLLLETQGPEVQFWRGSKSLRLQKQLEARTLQRDQLAAERDQLVAERDQLAAQKAELEQRLELINQEVDEILLLLDSAETEPPPAEASSGLPTEQTPQDDQAQD